MVFPLSPQWARGQGEGGKDSVLETTKAIAPGQCRDGLISGE